MFWKIFSKRFGKEIQCFVTFVVVLRAMFGMAFCGAFVMIFEMVSKWFFERDLEGKCISFAKDLEK